MSTGMTLVIKNKLEEYQTYLYVFRCFPFLNKDHFPPTLGPEYRRPSHDRVTGLRGRFNQEDVYRSFRPDISLGKQVTSKSGIGPVTLKTRRHDTHIRISLYVDVKL